MNENINIRTVPPYVDYHAFRVFLDELKSKLTERVDKDYLSKTVVAKSAHPYILVASRSLGLIDVDGKPTLLLASLLKDETELQKGLELIAKETYGDLLQKPEVVSGDRKELARYFSKTYNISLSTGLDCAAFFQRLAWDTKLIPDKGRHTRGHKTNAGPAKVVRQVDLRDVKAEIIRKLPDFSKDNWNPEGIKDVLQQFDKLLNRIDES